VDLAQIAWIRPLLQSRWPQFLARALTLAGFVFTILAGLFGTPVGSHNFAIIFVWIAWWTALKLAFIPFGGRSWCSVCPIPMPGEWLQQGGILGIRFTPERAEKRRGLGLRWPKRLRGTWLQSSGFLLIGLFSAVTLTNSRVTAWVLLALFGLAILLSLVFERRAFCSYVCPIGGFTGIYAQTAPVEVRVKDTAICAAHAEKTCYQNCPWGLYPVALKNSAACGLCMECLRSCPSDNIAVNLRPFGSDLQPFRSDLQPFRSALRSGGDLVSFKNNPRPVQTTGRLDEAFLALVMLGSALAFAAVFTGPWGALKIAAYEIGSLHWLAYALGFLALNLALLPGLFSLAVWAGQKISGDHLPLRKAIAGYARSLLPLGLAAWIAFTISFAFPKLSYVAVVLSDPLGWGWNLFGMANTSWNLDVTWFSPALQVAILLGGLWWATWVAQGQSRAVRPSARAGWQAACVALFCLAFTLGMAWLLVG
jgi:hypothetical protein